MNDHQRKMARKGKKPAGYVHGGIVPPQEQDEDDEGPDEEQQAVEAFHDYVEDLGKTAPEVLHRHIASQKAMDRVQRKYPQVKRGREQGEAVQRQIENTRERESDFRQGRLKTL